MTAMGPCYIGGEGRTPRQSFWEEYQATLVVMDLWEERRPHRPVLHSVALKLATSASHRSLWEMQILGLHSRPTNLKSVGLGIYILASSSHDSYIKVWELMSYTIYPITITFINSFNKYLLGNYHLITLIPEAVCILVNKTDMVFALAEFKFSSGEQQEWKPLLMRNPWGN